MTTLASVVVIVTTVCFQCMGEIDLGHIRFISLILKAEGALPYTARPKSQTDISKF